MFALIVRLLSSAPRWGRTLPAGGIARGLFESAEARAGRDPQQALELREAAHAYLRVVR